MHNVTLHVLHSSPYGTIKKSIEFWWEDLRGKRPLGRPTHRSEDDIKTGLKEIDCDTGNGRDHAQGRDKWQEYVTA